MRKSTRDVKKPEVFSFPEAPSSRTLAHSDDEDDLADSSQSISKPVARKVAKETSLFDSVGKGANKATEIIGKHCNNMETCKKNDIVMFFSYSTQTSLI